MPHVVLDTPHGDHGVPAACAALQNIASQTDIELTAVGPAKELESALGTSSGVHIVDADPLCSTRAACAQVTGGQADALVSAAPTRRLLESCRQSLKRIPGVPDIAVATVYPTRDRSFSNDRFALILDVGATARVDAQALHAFGLMGSAYSQRISKIPSPSVGLLNMSEDTAITDDTLERAHALLERDERLNFIGNVEGIDIPMGVADVIVCEGLIGNVLLKTAEGITDVLQGLGAWAFKRHLSWRLGLRLLGDGLRELKALTDYPDYGGEPVLGFENVVIKAHQKSGAKALANAIKVAAKAQRDDVCGAIAQSLPR